MWSFCNVCNPMGNSKVSQLFFLYLEKLLWKASFNHLEYSPNMFNVVNLARTQYPHFWRQWENIRSSKISPLWYSVSLGSYLGVYEFSSLSEFLVSISFLFLIILFLFLVQSVHHREHEVQFFSIKVLLPIKVCIYIYIFKPNKLSTAQLAQYHSSNHQPRKSEPY